VRMSPAIRNAQRGRGSIPVLIGLFVAGPLIGLLAVGVALGLHDPKSDRARLDLQNIAAAARLYEREKGQLPPAAQGLESLVDAQQLESIPRDPWGRDYLLRDANPGWEIATLGRDGVVGGDGQDADLSVMVRTAPPAPTVPPSPRR
jgi:general secretion pathway protein G